MADARQPMRLICAAFLLCGCYRFAEVKFNEITSPARVCVEVAPPGDIRLQTDTGVLRFEDVMRLEESLTATRSDSLVLREATVILAPFLEDPRRMRGITWFRPEANDRLHVRMFSAIGTAVAVSVWVAVLAVFLWDISSAGI